MADFWAIETKLHRDEGYAAICGVDEAGRGPLAGPVYAAAVVLPFGLELEGLNDSKKVTPRKRDALYGEITDKAVSFGIASASVEEIDKLNILNASFLAMSRAIEKLEPQPSLALIDGNISRGIIIPHRCIVKGDSLSASIAAASILAKVSRDRYMAELASEYPQYRFDKHKGYGTKLHYEMIAEHGLTAHHRRTFFKEKPGASAKRLGDYGERLAAGFLENKGFKIITANYKTRYGEVDIIASDGEFVVFAEVKLRKDDWFADAREFVTLSKQKKIRLAASEWLAAQGETAIQPRFDVIEVYAPQGEATARPLFNHIENAF